VILIAGAGIGGLTLGCALARLNHPFRLVDAAPELKPAGAGIALSDNAFRALAHVDLAERVRACGQRLEEGAICDPRGGAIASFRVSALMPGATIAMSRWKLQEALLAALGSPVETGRRVTGYDARDNRVRVEFLDGERCDADLLVGADGLHSAVRRAMRGDEALRYSGSTSWRALVDFDLTDTTRFTETWGARCRFGIVPIGGRSVYWFAVADAPPGGRDDRDPVAALHARFAGWHGPVDALIAATPPDRILRTDIFDRRPIRKWTDGRVALLGDAAHPMTPNMGMGGSQAIEDAVVLADALAREPEIARALARYERARVTRANRFVTRSYVMGRVAHAPTAPLRWVRNRLLAAVPARLVARAMQRDLDFRL
jgi:2-polyprenyl-6-methoxyphenol hydroxylase-like FAD-dependent oxidoreductase